MSTNVTANLANLEMLKEVIKNTKKPIIAEIERIINYYLAAPCGAQITHNRIEINCWDEPEIRVGIGFWNNEEGRIDFASDVDIEFNLKYGLRINHGCTGYAGEEHPYLMKRFKLLGLFAQYYNSIKYEFEHLFLNEWLNAEKEFLETRMAMEQEEREIRDAALKVINDSLEVGQKYIHAANNIPPLYRAWNYMNEVTIMKLTPKYVHISGLFNSNYMESKIKRDVLVNRIFEGKVMIVC